MPTRWIGFFLLASMILLGSWQAYADGTEEGILVNPSFSVREVNNISSGNETDFLFSLGAGYRLADGWYFGAMYSSTNSSGTDSVNEFDIGNSAGYYFGNLSIVFTIYLLSERSERTKASDITWGGGWGTEFDLSYMIPSGYGFNVGPTFTYRSITYNTEDNHTGNELSVDHNQTYLYPYVGFVVVF